MRILKYRGTQRARAVNRKRHIDNAERVRLHVTKGDTVRVMRGDDKGKEGKIIRVYLKTGRVTIEGVNLVKKHRRARTADEQSGIVESVSWPAAGEAPQPMSSPLVRGSEGNAAADGAFVAMTTRGRTGLTRMVLGSVADRVVRHSGAPVFLLRPE